MLLERNCLCVPCMGRVMGDNPVKIECMTKCHWKRAKNVWNDFAPLVVALQCFYLKNSPSPTHASLGGGTLSASQPQSWDPDSHSDEILAFCLCVIYLLVHANRGIINGGACMLTWVHQRRVSGPIFVRQKHYAWKAFLCFFSYQDGLQD